MIKLSQIVFLLVTLHLVGSICLAATCPVAMISYWELEEDGSEGYFDERRYSNTGVCAGTCPTVNVEGMVGNGQDFEDSDGIIVPASNVYNWGASDSFTIELWMKRTAGISSREILIGRDDTTSALRWYVGVEPSGKAVFYIRTSDGASQTLVGTKLLDNDVWHHIVAVRDSANNVNRLYVDGEEEAALAVAFPAGFESTGPLTLGYLLENDVPAFQYDGTIDEVAIYKQPRDESFIRAHYYLSEGYCSQYDNPVKIMPLGDSITYDDYSGDSRPASQRVAYRLSLWEFLDLEAYWFDFVGSMNAGDDYSPPFDPDNEGHPAFSDSDIAARVYNYLKENHADVVLLHIGTNDPDTNPDDVENILDEIDRYNEKITVILARIIKRVNDDGTTRLFNDAVEGMADLRIADGDKIVMVDMEDGAGIDYTIGVDMIDTIHPNESGYEKMADEWFFSLENILPPDEPLDDGDPDNGDPDNGDNSDQSSGGGTCFIGSVLNND
ncbi:MAG: LamG-like jellyroll fold domain-containing protein [Nitrospinales bacterium]